MWLESQRKTTSFVWIPSHIGIHGNELADQAARLATEGNTIEDIPIRPDDVKCYLKQKTIEKWQQTWNNTDTQLNRVKPNVAAWTYPVDMKRREQVVITRLRIGHTNLTSLFLLSGDRQPRCEYCRNYLSVNHILIQCPHYDPIRQRYNLPNNIENCLGNNPNIMRRVIQFLHEIRLFNKF